MPRPDPCFLDDLERLSHSGRPRWRSADRKRLYTWDDEHGGEVEVFNKRGKHMGVADPVTGVMIKPAVRGRTIDV